MTIESSYEDEKSVVIHEAGGFFVLYNVVYDHYLAHIGMTAFAVYAALCRYANQRNAVAFPAIPTIAGKLKIGDRAVQTAIKTLHAHGLIKVAPRFGADGRTTTNIYTICTPLDPSKDNLEEGDRRITPPVIVGSPPPRPAHNDAQGQNGGKKNPNKTHSNKNPDEDTNVSSKSAAQAAPLLPPPDIPPNNDQGLKKSATPPKTPLDQRGKALDVRCACGATAYRTRTALKSDGWRIGKEGAVCPACHKLDHPAPEVLQPFLDALVQHVWQISDPALAGGVMAHAAQLAHGAAGRWEGLLTMEMARQGKRKGELDYELLAYEVSVFARANPIRLPITAPTFIPALWAQWRSTQPRSAPAGDPAPLEVISGGGLEDVSGDAAAFRLLFNHKD